MLMQWRPEGRNNLLINIFPQPKTKMDGNSTLSSSIYIKRSVLHRIAQEKIKMIADSKNVRNEMSLGEQKLKVYNNWFDYGCR